MVYQLKYQELNDEFEERKVHRQVLKAGEQTFNEGLPQTVRRARASLIIVIFSKPSRDISLNPWKNLPSNSYNNQKNNQH